MNCDQILTLVSTDNQVFEINVEDLKICDFLIKMHNLDMDNTVIHINTNGRFLQIIIDFLKSYNKYPFDKIQKPVPKNFNNCVFITETKETFKEEFYTKLLINFEKTNEIMQFLHIVNYLGIKPLLELVCARIANIIRDMSSEDEKKFLQIKIENV